MTLGTNMNIDSMQLDLYDYRKAFTESLIDAMRINLITSLSRSCCPIVSRGLYNMILSKGSKPSLNCYVACALHFKKTRPQEMWETTRFLLTELHDKDKSNWSVAQRRACRDLFKNCGVNTLYDTPLAKLPYLKGKVVRASSIINVLFTIHDLFQKELDFVDKNVVVRILESLVTWE